MIKYKANNRKHTKGRAVRLQTIEYQATNNLGTKEEPKLEVITKEVPELKDKSGKVLRASYRVPVRRRKIISHVNI